LLVRHLVLPGNLSGTGEVLAFIAQEISPHTYLNLMAQYHPCYRSSAYPPLDRSLTRAEYQSALELAQRYGLHRLERDWV
jgi:putative pyruvate formate lyase activating enzyme